MIFKTVEDEASLFGKRISTIFNGIAYNVSTISLPESFNIQLETDVTALNKYKAAIDSGVRDTEKLASIMQNASVAAQELANSNNVTATSIQNFVIQQKQAQVTQLAQSKTLSGTASIIKTYNEGLDNLGLTQQQFTDSVSQGNAKLGKYLSTVEQGKANIVGYGLSLVGAKVATIALQAVTMAFNMAISGLISLGISWVFQQITNAIESSKKSMEEAAQAAEELKQTFDDIDSYKQKINELKTALSNDSISQADATEKRKELLKIQEELIEKYGKEKEAVDYITESIQGETDALDGLSQSAAKDYLRNHQGDIDRASTYFSDSQDFAVGVNTQHDDGVAETLKNIINSNEIFSDAWFDNASLKWHFQGARDEVVKQLDVFYDEIEKYMKEHDLSNDAKQDFENALQGISDTRKSIISDESYDQNKDILNQAVESAIAVNDEYAESYKKIAEAKKEYENAVVENNQSAIEAAYNKEQKAFDELFGSGFKFVDVGNVKAEDIENYFKDIQTQFNEISKDTGLKIQIKADVEDPSSIVSKIKEELSKENNQITYDDIQAFKSIADLQGVSSFTISSGYNGVPPEVEESNELTAEQARLYNNIAEAAEKAGVSVDDYVSSLVDLGIIQNQVSDGTEESAFSATKYSDDIKNLQSNINTLKSAYDKLKSGELDADGVLSLVADKFPEILNYTDDLGEGLKVLAGKEVDKVIEKLQEVDTSTLSESDLTAYNSLIEYIKQINSGFDETINLLKEIQTMIKNVSGTITSLNSLSKEISENGFLSLSSIDTILTDDTYQSLRPYINDMEGMQTAIEELVNKQKDAYEDLYNAEMYETDYEAFHEAVEKKKEENENLYADAKKEIKQEIAEFNAQYNCDITNWGSLSDEKKAALQNTNAELLNKQWQLISDFESTYGVDLDNYKALSADKMKIAKETDKQIRDIFSGQFDIYYDTSVGKMKINASDDDIKKVNQYLKSNGYNLTYKDIYNDILNGTLDQRLGAIDDKKIEQILKPYTITPTTWNNLTSSASGSGSGSNSSSGTDTAKSESSKFFDWIERRLKKFANNTKQVFSKVGDYITFKGKNKQLSKSINAIEKEISFNENAYGYYMDEANKVGLSDYWKKAVQEGGRNLSEISDSDLREKIEKYQELYDKAISCKDAVASLKETEKEYIRQQLDNIETYYDNRINYVNADSDYYDNLDKDTRYVNKNYKQLGNNYKKTEKYETDKAANLNSQLQYDIKYGKIKVGDDYYYKYKTDIKTAQSNARKAANARHQLAVEELGDIQTRWENRSSVYGSKASLIETKASDSTRKASKDYSGLRSTYKQQSAYALKEADDLQKKLNEAVKNGDIQKYSNAWYEWTENIAKAKENAEEYKKTIHELTVEEFNDIATKHDNKLNRIANQESKLNESVTQTQEKGYLVSTKYYDALIKNEKNNRSELVAKKNDLTAKMKKAIASGDIEEGSQAWHDMMEEIEKTDIAIQQCDTSIIKFNKSIREIQWQIFDLIQEKISQITQESDFLIKLMQNDKLYKEEGEGAGQLTNEGKATMGLHGVNYNTYMAQADKYAKEIKNIDKEIAKDKNNQDLIDRRNELLKLQQQSILSANDEKQAIVDMVKEGINLELSALQDLIDKYNEALDSQKDLYSYQKNIKDQTKEIASLQKQLTAYGDDTSEETKAKVQQLKVSLEEAKENLEETQYDKFISDQKKLLDDLYDEYEKTLNERLDNVDALISDMITNINDNAGIIKETLVEQASDVGYTISSTMNDIWQTGANPVLTTYTTNFTNAANNVITAINALTTSINNMVTELGKEADKDQNVKDTKSNTTTTTSKTTTTAATKTNTTTASKTNTTSNSSSKTGNAISFLSGLSSSAVKKAAESATKNSTSASKTSTTTATKTTKRTTKENYGVALAAINGNYGWSSGDTRKKRMTAKGFDYNTVQGIINKLVKEGYVNSGAWKGRYYGITDLSPYHYNKFKQGTYKINKDQMAWTQENGVPEAIIRPSDGAILTPLAKEDMVLNGNATANLFSMMNDPSKFIKDSLFENSNASTVPNISNNTNSVSVNLENVNFTLPNVKNYDEFIYAMQHDKKFESLIKSMTTDRLFGGSSLKKYRV